jgi:hypothetical protein
MGSRAGAEWARHKAVVQKREQENLEQKKQRAAGFGIPEIIWELPASMAYKKVGNDWHINGENLIGGFIYVLKVDGSNAVRYVGQTNEPTRRYMEHRNDDKLGTTFKMFIVDIGDAETEREYITRHLAEGCDLLNLVLTKPKTK